MTIFGYRLEELRKAVVPGGLALLAVFTNYLASGEWSQTEFAIALSGVVVIVLNFSLTNSQKYPILKAIVPPIIVNIAVLTKLLETGELDRAALSATIYSVVAGFITWRIPNVGLPGGSEAPPALTGSGGAQAPPTA